jgi:hypothetical protein
MHTSFIRILDLNFWKLGQSFQIVKDSGVGDSGVFSMLSGVHYFQDKSMRTWHKAGSAPQTT